MESHDDEINNVAVEQGTENDTVQADNSEQHNSAIKSAEIKRFPDRQIARKTLYRVIIGIWLLAAVVCVTGVWFVEYKLAYLLGELVGSGIATGLMFHLFHCIDVELDLGEDRAPMHSKVNAMLRLFIEIAAVAGCCFIPEIINPVTVLIGLFGRKIGALMVPVFFDKERTGEMTEEDREQLRVHGRLLSRKEMRELEEAEEENSEGASADTVNSNTENTENVSNQTEK